MRVPVREPSVGLQDVVHHLDVLSAGAGIGDGGLPDDVHLVAREVDHPLVVLAAPLCRSNRLLDVCGEVGEEAFLEADWQSEQAVQERLR